jgi:hypothetical protein
MPDTFEYENFNNLKDLCEASVEAIRVSSGSSTGLSLSQVAHLYGFNQFGRAKCDFSKSYAFSSTWKGHLKSLNACWMEQTCGTGLFYYDLHKRPIFTEEFINELYHIDQHLSMLPSQEELLSIYAEFTRTFGTHYAEKIYLGGRKDFITLTTSTKEQVLHSKCISECTKQTQNASFEDIKTCFNKHIQGCFDQTREFSYTFQSDSLFNHKEEVKPFDEPLVVHLRNIADLLTPQNLQMDDEYGFNKPINAERLEEFILDHMEYYCAVVAKLDPKDCKIPFQSEHIGSI